MSNVRALPGCSVQTGEPNSAIVSMLTDLLDRAKEGKVQSIIATGFMSDGTRLAVWGDHHTNVYEMLGALSWLHAEYIHKHTAALK